MRELIISRVETDGSLCLYTKMRLPDTTGWSKETNRLARELGENLLMDSSLARRLLQLPE